MMIVCRASVNDVSVSTQVTDLPSSRSSFRHELSGDRLILPWKCRLESWLSDHFQRWYR